MNNIISNNRYKRNFGRWFTIVFLIFLIFILTKAAWGISLKERESRNYRIKAENEYLQLEEREKTLTEDIKMLNTEYGIEEEIRRKFSVTKEGEKVIVLIDVPGIVESNNNFQNKSIWQRIKGFLGF